MKDEVRFILKESKRESVYSADTFMFANVHFARDKYISKIKIEAGMFRYESSADIGDALELDWNTVRAIIASDGRKGIRVVKVTKHYEEVQE